MDFPSFLKMSFVSFSCPIGPKWMKRWRRLWSLRTPSTSAWTASTFAWKDPGSCCPSSNITGVLSAEELGVCVCVWCNLCLHTNLQLKGKTRFHIKAQVLIMLQHSLICSYLCVGGSTQNSHDGYRYLSIESIVWHAIIILIYKWNRIFHYCKIWNTIYKM